MSSHPIRVAIVGVGNCAASLVQGAHYYKDADPKATIPGLMHVEFGQYHVGDVEFVAAFDVDGKKVGVLDADVWGYSIPRMLGLGGQRPNVSPERKILPLEAHGLKVMSIGFFLDEDEAVVWRGPMLHKALTQFLEDVAWGELDHLLIDLPPALGRLTLNGLIVAHRVIVVTEPAAYSVEAVGKFLQTVQAVRRNPNLDAGLRVATLEHPWNRDICEEEDIVCAPDWPSLARALEPLLQGAPR